MVSFKPEDRSTLGCGERSRLRDRLTFGDIERKIVKEETVIESERRIEKE
jgi:hypothetical protein